jgi:alpha-L-arabinofuranosidase
MKTGRRNFLKSSCMAAASPMLGVVASPPLPHQPNTIVIDPQPLFDLSPFLAMQFMEPLGATDGSVEAAWDYDADDWRKDLVDVVRDLGPGLVRFGGLFSRYYRWREGVGPVATRPPMRNYAWGGMERNRVGTREFVDFCRRVGAQPLYCVNFLSDGRRQFWKTRDGTVRTGDAQEAADWVTYANDPDSAERKAHGVQAPYSIKLWQLGNETSYGTDGFSKDESIAHTIEFARAMKARDPSIQLIGWGDRPRPGEPLWAGDLVERAGEYLDYVAIHMMGQRPTRRDTVLDSLRYQQEPEQAWQELLELSSAIETRVKEVEDALASRKSPAGIAVTEGHPSLRPHNCNPILQEWLTGVFHARSLNIYERHGAKVKIATAADFCGTRWTVNAVIMPVPRGASYLMPVGSVMRLFKRYSGKQAVAVSSCPTDLDIAASRTGNQVFLHVANLSYSGSVDVNFAVEGMAVLQGRIFEIAPANLREYVNEDRPEIFVPREASLIPPGFHWRFPPGSVSAVQLEVGEPEKK